jgi:general stress protein CsbA
MNLHYRSKISYGLFIPILLVLLFVSVQMLRHDKGWMGLIVTLPILGYFIYLIWAVRYTLSSDHLHISAGFIYNKKIALSEIRSLVETNNPLSSPALSLDRIDVRFGKSGTILISPKDKERFMTEVLNRAPHVEIKRMKRFGKK